MTNHQLLKMFGQACVNAVPVIRKQNQELNRVLAQTFGHKAKGTTEAEYLAADKALEGEL